MKYNHFLDFEYRVTHKTLGLTILDTTRDTTRNKRVWVEFFNPPTRLLNGSYMGFSKNKRVDPSTHLYF